MKRTGTVLLGFLMMLSQSILSRAQQSDELREEFHQSYPLLQSGRLSLENINGFVRIEGWDRNEVKVDAVKHAYTAERLAEAKIEVENDAEGVRIRTTYPDRNLNFNNDSDRRRNNPASVDYTIMIPKGARLDSVELINGRLQLTGLRGTIKGSSINGEVIGRGLAGDVKLSTINGTLDAGFESLQDVRQVSLSSVNGTVNLTMPSDANAQVRASTVHGNIENGYGIPVRKGQYVGRDLSATLGSGVVSVKLQNVNGGIYIKHAQDNRPLSPVSNVMAEETDAKDVDRASRDAERIARQAAREARAAAREAARVSTDVATATNVETRTQLAQAAREQNRVRAEMREVQRQTAAAAREASYVAGGARYRLVERDTKTFAVNGIARVHVNTFDGSVVVRSWDKNEVSYTSVKRAADEQNLRSATVDANQSADSITISTRVNGVTPPDSKISVNVVVNFEVYVPRNTELTVDSGDGRLTVEGVKGKIDLKTGDGPVSVVDSKGTLSVDTKDGGVRLEGFEGAASVHTGDGRISLSGNFSQLNAETREGTVSLQLPATANANLETTAEDVENDGIAVEEPSSSKTVRRWKVGAGGSLFRLRSGEGRIYLRKAL